ncbi:MAG TPA: DUF2235 domain-containing protein [Vicinamibacterales bacterium]|nr:DUF2235 domain-containing protein [Vicinamibacterales bacterium]
MSTSTSKSIVLFSDGTGNSSAKLFKTNVWRMYEAVDLGPSAEGKRDQIAYYDDGVGTSSFKPLTVLGGAFGWGLQRNVLDIYQYACRNYRDGDDIYAFGFSRGAFTARLVVALIASQGLVRSTSEAELDWKSREAYRAFRADFVPRLLQWPTKLSRRISRAVRRWRNRLEGYGPYDPAENCRPKIRFVGVWDTVAAYGGPITEITRAIDNWIYPMSMPDYQLHEQVLCARHALALDDERDAFQPLVWDEVHEASLVERKIVDERRLEQVWFTGMHADVGGGYPDESLSYVSLLWMMEEAENAGLRTLKVVKDRFVALASSFGPIHDSRAGMAAYYRYQPRRIAAWLDPVSWTTLSLRDPAITDEEGRSRGLLRRVKIHESVINRIATGTDRYAPITLPEAFNVVPPQVEGETAPQADNQGPAPPLESNRPKPMVTHALRARLTDPIEAGARASVTEKIWNYVWWRRLTYFATLTSTLLLLALPLFVGRLPTPPVLADGRTGIGGVIRLSTLVLPDFAGKLVEVYANNPFYFFVLAAIIFMFLRIGTRLERTLRDEARTMWKQATEGVLQPADDPSWTQSFRTSVRYQRFIQWSKWQLLPNWIVTPLLFIITMWVGLALYAQAALPFLENGNALCRPTRGGAPEITSAMRDFLTRNVCSDSFGGIVQDHRYVVTFDVVDPWYDSSLATNPSGLAVADFPWGLGYAAAPFRRVLNARYLQPVFAVRPDDRHTWFDENIQIYPLELRAVGDSVTLYRTEFIAPRSGQLFIFVNDAMLPLGRLLNQRYFYESSGWGPEGTRGNRGTACVTVERVSVAEPPLATPPHGSVCGQAEDRADKARP